MPKPRPRHTKYFFSAFLLLFFLAGKPVEFGQENTFFYGFLIKNPVINIGLAVNLDDLTIAASSGMKVYEVGSSYRLLADDIDEVHLRGHREKLTEKYLLLVAQTEKKEQAEKIALELKSKIGRNVSVTADSAAKMDGTYQVRVGDFLTRGEALGFIKTLSQIGIKEAWILREEVTEEESHPLWVLINDELETLNRDTVIYFIPSSSQSFLIYNGRQYRGIFVLKGSRKGLVLVNVLNLENYLKGVVPRELSPYQFNAFEALKAQAVAARTYAIRNRGMYRELGFDLCDTPQCQVYGGMSAEHPLSTRAVEATSGEVALYQGKLINALYTSTCGGMTEDIENVFEGQSQPYLKSTECTYEKQKEWVAQGQGLLPIVMGSRTIEREVAFLIGLGILPPETSPSFFQQPAAFEEAVLWMKKTLAVLGKPNEGFFPSEMALNYPNLAVLFVEAFQWGDRVENLILKSEVEFILKDFPPVRNDARDKLALLIHSGVLLPAREMAEESRMVTRGELALALFKTVRSCVEALHQGIFRGLVKNELEVEEKGQSRKLLLPAEAFLFKSLAGERFPAGRLTLLGGEEMSWVENQGAIKVLEVSYPADSPVLDRSSPFYRWQVRQSRGELEERINDYYPIGRLVDVAVQERGKSHRVTQLLITGTESQVLVNGLKVRLVLGLRDTLFAVDKEYDEDGQITHFTFTGRGWGHGVGLCQVGSFRMAQAGASYKDILKKYYRDIKISKSY